MLNKEKGITLIALVITIIVLLILAGVSIAMLTGQNGILTQAQNASEATLKGEAEEAVKLAINTIMTNQSASRAGVNYNASDPNSVTSVITTTTADVVKVIGQNDSTCKVQVGTAGDVMGSSEVTILYKNNENSNLQATVKIQEGVVTGSTVEDATF